MARLGRNEAEQVLEGHKGKPYFAELAALLASDLVLALEVLAENCIAKVKDLVSIVRSKFGTDLAHPAVLGSESTASAARELEIFFSAKSQLQSPAYFTNCSCLVVKPHLVTENYVGQVIDAVLSSGFEISAAEMFWLDRPSAEVLSLLLRNFWKFTRELCLSTVSLLRNLLMGLALPWKSGRRTSSQLSASSAALMTPKWPKQSVPNLCAQSLAATRAKTAYIAPTCPTMESCRWSISSISCRRNDHTMATPFSYPIITIQLSSLLHLLRSKSTPPSLPGSLKVWKGWG